MYDAKCIDKREVQRKISFDHYTHDLSNQWYLCSSTLCAKLTGVYLISLEMEQSNKNIHFISGFGVLTAVLMKVKVFWDMTPCRLVNIYQRTPRNVSEALTLRCPVVFLLPSFIHVSHVHRPAVLLQI